MPQKNRHKLPAVQRPAASTKHIPEPSAPSPEVLLSFKHLSLNDKLTPKGKGDDYFAVTLERLKEACRLTPHEMKQSGRQWRCHTIKWEETSEPKGYDLMPPAFRDSEPMQISLGKADGRLHGFFVGNTFYVVWFDAHHKLYP